MAADVTSSLYYGNSRPELHDLVPATTGTMLDVGCGEGAFGAALMERRPDLKVWGVELTPAAASIAASRYEEVAVGSFLEAVSGMDQRFDLIAFNDVLEHMVDPWTALAASADLLAEGGMVLVSMPNIASFGVIRQLLRGEFNYADSGVLDRTHVRFFTRKTAMQLAEGAGFSVSRVRYSWPHRTGWRGRLLTLVGLEGFNGRQVVMLLSPKERAAQVAR